MTDPQQPAGLVCTGLTKSLGGVTVLKGIDFAVPGASVIGLIGENGAGKSTLSSLITGVHRPDSGTMTLDGQPYAPATPGEALDAGVVLIHQEIRLLPELTVAENIFLGRLPSRAGRIDRQRMYEESREVLDLLGAHVDPNRLVRGCRWRSSRRSRSPRRSPASRATSSSTSRRHRWVVRRPRRSSTGSACCATRARASSTSPTASTRCARSPTASSACATASGWPPGTPAACRGPTSSTRWSGASSPTRTRRRHLRTTARSFRCATSAGTACSPTSTSRWTRARYSGSPGSSEPDAPRRCGPSRAPTAPTPAR